MQGRIRRRGFLKLSLVSGTHDPLVATGRRWTVCRRKYLVSIAGEGATWPAPAESLVKWWSGGRFV